MLLVRQHYRRIEREIASPGKLKLENLQEPIVIVPILNWTSIEENALRFAMTMSREVEALHIESADNANRSNGFGRRAWKSRRVRRTRRSRD
jgi:hypothetical protein